MDISQADPLVVAVRESVVRHELFSSRGSSLSTDPISVHPPSKIFFRSKQATQQTQLSHHQPDILTEVIESTTIPPKRRPVVVAVSGGADSMCLIHILAQFREIWALDLHIAHFNHNLRPEASEDAAFVAQIAGQFNLPFHIGVAPAGQMVKNHLGVEGASRQYRYRFLIAIAKAITPAGQQPLIALAHHSDDQAETILMNLIRGSGLRGLSGMDWQSTWTINRNESNDHELDMNQADANEVATIRPLLGLQRQEIVDFLHRYNIFWIEDATNSDPAFLRNRIRHEIIPLLQEINPNLTATVSRTAETIRAELNRSRKWDWAAFIQTQVVEHVKSQHVVKEHAKERVVFDLLQLLAQEQATQRNIIRMALAQVIDAREGGNTGSGPAMNDSLRNIGFDLVDSVLAAVRQHYPPGVTHPIAKGIGWTVGNLTGERPLLSIHADDLLPFWPEHPLLDEAWQRQHKYMVIPRKGHIVGPNDWLLYSEILSISDLPKNWQVAKDDWEAYLDSAAVGELYLTTPPSTARFAPLGLDGQHQSIAHLFTNRKVLKPFRSRWPTVVQQDLGFEKEQGVQVIWVCGQQLAHAARITDYTETVRHLYWTQRRDCR